MNKKFLNRKKKVERPIGDLYNTPMSLVWELLKIENFNNTLEPACGNLSIVKASEKFSNKANIIEYSDIIYGKDFFKREKWNGDILTNPPFSLWDSFVFHAKQICSGRICFLGRTDYFGCVGRYKSDIWNSLKSIYVFNRKVDYRTPFREDGLFNVGGLVTGWFIWEKKWNGPITLDFIDVQKYAKLGNFKNI